MNATMLNYCPVRISDDEKEKFLAGNAVPRTMTECFLWGAINNSFGVVYLFADEIENAALMAERAGLPKFAERIRAAK